MASSRLVLPSRKLLLEDLIASEKTDYSTNIDGLNVWKYYDNKTSSDLLYSMVWIQGKVTKLCDDGNFILEDGTGRIEILKPSNVPPTQKPILTGHYIMVIGEVLHTGIQPQVRASKIHFLTEDTSSMNMWKTEVASFKKSMSQIYRRGIPLEG